MNRSVRQHLTWTLLPVIAGLVVAGDTLVYLAQRKELTEQFDTNLLGEAEIVWRGANAGLEVSGRIEALRQDSGEHDGIAAEFFEIRRSDGTLVLRSRSLGNGSFAPPAPLSYRPAFWELPLPHHLRGRAVGMVFKSPVPGEGDAQVIFAEDRNDLDEALRSSLTAIVGTGALLLVVTLIVIPKLLRRALASLDDFAIQVAGIDARNLGPRVTTTGAPQELVPIANRVNELLARIESSVDRERRMNANLAHELRTPVAELRIIAESALKWPATRDPATDHDALAIALHLETIVERTLALARSEANRLELLPTAVDLAELIRETWANFSRRATERGLAIAFDLQPVPMVTDRFLMRSIIANLFDNAVDHAPTGAVITVGCRGPQSGPIEFWVANRAALLAPEDVPRLFERYWRKDGARIATHHVGIGLSLVQSFAAALGFESAATLNHEQLLTITLRQKSLGGSPGVIFP